MSVPLHYATAGSADTLDSDERKAGEDDEDEELASKTHGLSRIFFDANMYGKVLNDDHECVKSSEGLRLASMLAVILPF